ncbi:MAG: methyltransferase domain-containing protein [bacterium]|nr:methyltransferase domain-containing protein [bacterium]MDE0601808.1 methyltransferase domain-containing protein [bacterium]
MALNISNTWKGRRKAAGTAPTVGEYEQRFGVAEGGPSEDGTSDHKHVNNLYYDLVTDFFEYGWGRSFHFAPRVPGESFKASLARHEHFIALALGLKPGMVVADFGSGVGGPLLEIARFSGAKIVGLNSNAYQLERARQLAEEAELSHLADFLHCDFLEVDAPDESFDAAYSIEATCCAPDKVSVYTEVFRLLKPGARFAAYEYAVTDRFDPQDPHHLQLKADIQLGGGLLVIDDRETIDNALVSVGFEVLETRDLSVQTGPSIPWYEPLVGSGLSVANLRSSKIGRWFTHHTLRVMEGLRIAPRGTVRVQETLELCAVAMAEAGRLGIFTPMYFIHARKPA